MPSLSLEVVHDSSISFAKLDEEVLAELPFDPLPEYQEYVPVEVVLLPVPE